jgi:uncharacterized membrane protein
MKHHARIFVEGLIVVLPAALTGYLLYKADLLIRNLTGGVLPPGTGLPAGLVAIYGVGWLTHLCVLRTVLRAWEAFIERVPLVKTIYGSVRDLLAFLKPKEGAPAGRAVRVDLGGGAQMIGIATSEDERGVGVYLPMSYQIGGFLVYIPRESVAPAGMDVETALKHVLTGGMGTK